ncbi:MAG: hypothetical protein ABJH52_07150 [Henriciella sp.]
MTEARVELDDVRAANHHDIARHFNVLGFQDIGLSDRIEDAFYIRFNVFQASKIGLVPVLRTYSADDDLILSQVLSHQFPPIMGISALASPIGEQLVRNEEAIVLTSFRKAANLPH